MKLQIENQHLRLRVDESELAKLLGGERIESRTHFGRAFPVAFTLWLTDDAEASITGQPDAWHMQVPRVAVVAHAERLPTREGLRFILSTGDSSEPLTVLFDVDVRDSARRRKTH